jgi:methylphosphotriester-DNA--protein-cysteine methyltransferase
MHYDLFDAPTKSKSNGNGHPAPTVIVCRVVGIDEAELLRVLNIHNAEGMARSAWRRLARKHADLTPADVARAIREVRLMAELWIDAVAAEINTLKTHKRPVYRRRRRRLAFQLPRPTQRAEASAPL